MNAMAWLFVGLAVLGQPEGDKEEVELKEVLYPYYAREAAGYEFFLDEERKQRLELQKQPVLTWTNVNNFMGSVFVWTYGGRPEVIGCIGSHQLETGQSNVFHEFHSLSLQPLQAVKLGGGTQKWDPASAGVELADVEGAPAPAESERLRLTQMRNMAREFNGSMKDGADVTELRLLTQPIARYKAPERGVVDGAIFAFVWKGTDPEILLVLEDRKDASKDKAGGRWQYALARFNWREMSVKRKDKEVWRVEVARSTDNYITGLVGLKTLAAIRAAASEPDEAIKPAKEK